MATAALPPSVDWATVEKEYRTGLYSFEALAARTGGAVTRDAIAKRAKRHGWVQALGPAVKRERERQLAGVTADEAAVSSIAAEQAEVIRSHKDIAARLRRLIGAQVVALEDDTELKPPVKAQTARHLSGALGTVADVERKAHGIDETPPEVESYETRLKRLIEAAQE